MRIKIFLISLILSLPFWWGANILAGNLEFFLFRQELAKNPGLLTADLDQKIFEKKVETLKSERLQVELFKNLEINAKTALSLEVDNKGDEKILFEKNSQESLPIASLTKLMTALVIFDLTETYDFSQPISITKKAVNQEGSSKYDDLRVGEELSVGDLLCIMLIESSNDAAFALTEPIGEKAFVDLMNLYARDIGLENTYFVNSTGLELGGTSTARDLVKLARYIIDNYPQIFEITIHQQYGTVTNTNELLGEVSGIIGGKTGWSPEAGGCLLLVLDNPKGSGYFINIILGAQDRFQEMRKIIDVIM